jgi:hypothetical protein
MFVSGLRPGVDHVDSRGRDGRRDSNAGDVGGGFVAPLTATNLENTRG